jgi:signal transduction histidine kinase
MSGSGRESSAAILIVDDQRANLSVLSDYLRQVGYRTLIARDGESALERARFGRPDLILLDVLMPGIDGFETCRRLKADPAVRDIPVIFTTALHDTVDKLSGFQVGGVDYVTKPFQTEELLARVQVHLALRAAQRQIEERNAELQRVSDALREAQAASERKVHERTAELAQVNQVLRRSRDLLEALFDSLEDGLMLLDQDGRVLTLNRALLGLTVPVPAPGELTGQLWPELCARYPALAGLEAVAATLADAQGRRQRVRQANDEQPARMLDLRTIPILDDQGRMEQLVAHVVDITRQLQIEAHLLESERFAASGRLAAAVAHEVNTPLQSIQSFLYLLTRAPARERSGYIAMAQQEIERIGRILHQLLDLYHPSTHQTAPLLLNDLLDRMLMLNDPLLARHRIVVQRAFARDLPLVLGRADLLIQVGINLLVNAVQAMPGGGALSIRTGLAGQDDAPLPDAVCVEISDSGAGIASEDIERIFEPFYTTKANGNGLGLSICRQIIQEHNGVLSVSSAPGLGSTFRIYLPSYHPDEGDKQ